jgi:hypothetical protein
MATAYTVTPLYAAQIDRLGDIKARIADLKLIEADLIAAVVALGVGAHEGLNFRVAVSTTAESFSLDPVAAEAKLRELGVDGRWFNKHQKTRKGSTAVRVSARKSK